MEISLNTRAETAKLFLDTIRPLKSCYSPGHAFLHVGDSGVHYGEKAARMEGFARVLWGLGPLWAGGTKDFTLREQIQITKSTGAISLILIRRWWKWLPSFIP